MTDIVIGFVLSLTFLFSLAGGILGFMAWREGRRNRESLAQGLKVMADLIEVQARSVRLDPSQTGSPALRALAAQIESGAPKARREPRPRSPMVRMRPLEDHEEWALEQERKGWSGLEGDEILKAQRWAKQARDTRLSTSEA